MKSLKLEPGVTEPGVASALGFGYMLGGKNE